MSKSNFHQQIENWTRPTFPDATPQTVAMRIVEEGVEMALATGLSGADVVNTIEYIITQTALKHFKQRQKTIFGFDMNFRSELSVQDIESEVGDVVICCADILSLVSTNDIMLVTLQKLGEVQKRRFTETGPDGQRQSIKET